MSTTSNKDLSIANISIYDPNYPEVPNNAKQLILALENYTLNSTIYRLFFTTMHVLIEKENDGETKNKELVMDTLEFLNVDWNLFWIYKLSLDTIGLDNVIEITYKILDLPFIENDIEKLKLKSEILHGYCLELSNRFRRITSRATQIPNFYY